MFDKGDKVEGEIALWKGVYTNRKEFFSLQNRPRSRREQNQFLLNPTVYVFFRDKFHW